MDLYFAYTYFSQNYALLAFGQSYWYNQHKICYFYQILKYRHNTLYRWGADSDLIRIAHARLDTI